MRLGVWGLSVLLYWNPKGAIKPHCIAHSEQDVLGENIKVFGGPWHVEAVD